MNASTDPVLVLLRRYYGRTWRIRCTEHLWIATALDRDTGHAPTVIHNDLAAFIRELEDPPPRVGGRWSLLSSSWVRDQLEQIGDDGAYRANEPPVT